MGGWVDGWMDVRVGGKAGLRIAYSNQKPKKVTIAIALADRLLDHCFLVHYLFLTQNQKTVTQKMVAIALALAEYLLNLLGERTSIQIQLPQD